MHPTLMTMFADERATDLRAAAVSRRRGRLSSARGSRRFFALRRPRRAARIAHA